MALFKMFNNIDSKNTTLPNTYTKGYMYYDVKDSIFYIDIDGTGGNTGTRQKINAWGAEKSLKDSLNQQIDTTYIKGISISDNKLSYTLGNGTSHTVEGTLGAVTGVKGNAETTYRTGQINLTPENIGAATSGHTHTTTIATDSGTSQLTLAFGTKYKLTAGGTSYIFTMPANPNTNTASAVDNILDGSNSGTAITYAPYASQQAKLSFDTSTTNPTRTDRLNLNGYLYATKLYSGGKEVLTAHQSLSNYKTKQTAVSSATAETSTATTFVYSVTQNDNGEITVKTRPLPTYNNYTLPKATDGALGGIKTGYSASGKNYAIKVDANGNAYVNVPWENTHQDISGKANLNSPAFTGTPTAPTAANGTNSTQIATTAFVMNAFTANDAMVFKGVLGTESGMIATLPTTHSQGWTYKVGTAGTYAGQVCEVGDTIYCVADGTAANNAHWVILQTNVDGTVIGPATSTADHIATFTGTTGKVIKDSGFTIGTSVPANAVFTDTNKYHKTGSWSGLTYTAQAVNSADELKFTIPSATTSVAGAVQLSSATNSTSETLAATAKAVKTAYDLAASKTSNTGTVTSVATGVGLTGGTITGSGTIKAKLRNETALTNDSAAATETSGRVYPVAIDKSGYLAVNVPWTNINNSYLTSHQTVSNKGATLAWGTSTTIATIGSTNINVSLPANPNSDTKNTAGSTDTSSKIFLIGATSQAANPQTYSDNQVYATNGQLDANKIRIAEQVSLVFNSTTNALDFVFA